MSGLQNDHKALMTDIEAGLHQLHAETKVQKDLQDMEVDQQTVAPPTSVPFSVVTHIEPGSPAFAAVGVSLMAAPQIPKGGNLVLIVPTKTLWFRKIFIFVMIT